MDLSDEAHTWAEKALALLSFADEDGILGKNTLMALNSSNADKLTARFNGARLEFMTNLANWNSFSKGWARRIAKNLLGET
jgi:lysozyme family protein